jgi:hypothetical protein
LLEAQTAAPFIFEFLQTNRAAKSRVQDKLLARLNSFVSLHSSIEAEKL